jgi:membrane protein implicated in regulation of membrane protease activity
MNAGWLVVLILVVAAVTVAWRRRREPDERRRDAAERRDDAMKRVEAYSFPVLGAVIAGGALVYWEPWVSIAGLAIGALFLFAGLASLRELRRRRVGRESGM